MTGLVHVRDPGVDDDRATAGKPVHHLGDRPLVAGDGVAGEDDDVAVGDREAAVLADREQ